MNLRRKVPLMKKRKLKARKRRLELTTAIEQKWDSEPAPWVTRQASPQVPLRPPGFSQQLKGEAL